MEKLLEKLTELEEKLGDASGIIMCLAAYKAGGIEEVYKVKLKPKAKARKDNKKAQGKRFDETRFEVSYINSRLKELSNLLQLRDLMESAEDRKIIADELTRLAEELRNL